MLNKAGTVGNTMSDVRDLLRSNNKQGKFGMKGFLPTTVAETPASTISMDDDIDVAIVKLMMSFKGYTTDEVYQLLRERVSDPEAVKPTMFMLNNHGWFDQTQVHGKPVYTLRRGKSYQDLETAPNRQQLVVRRRKAVEEGVAVNSAGRVIFAEGIDLAIWKVMCDRRWRKPDEIIAILREFNFERAEIDRRLNSMVRSNHWFDRSGTGNRATYRLKANVPQPEMEKPMEGLKATFSPDDVPQAAGAAQIVVPKPTPKLDIMFSPLLSDETKQRILGDGTAAEEVPAKQSQEIMPGDCMNTAVWKVMSDREEYTANEIGLLIVDYGFTASSASPVMSKFHAQGFVDRREERQPGRKPFFVYRLKDMPMPTFTRTSLTKLAIAPVTKVSKDSELKDAVEQFNQTPVQQPVVKAAPAAQPETNETKEDEVTQSATPLLQIVPSAENTAPLLDCKIVMKGTEISLLEFGQLYKELRAAGFQANRTHKASLIQANGYNIKGVMFSAADLDELVGKMNDLGIAFQKAVTL
jgi:hypothetical protein